MRQTLRCGVSAALFGVTLSFFAPQAAANEQVLATDPHPTTAEDLQGPLEAGFDERPEPPDSLFPRASEWLEAKPEPIRGTEFGYDFRSYYFDRENSSTDQARAWTAGGQLKYTSGWWNNVALSAAWYMSEEIDAPSDEPGTGLLLPDNGNINVLGEINLRVRFPDREGDMQLRLGRQRLDLPFVNKHDIRAVPASHEGILLVRRDSVLDFGIGHLTKFKDYDSDDFLYMSEAAGAPGTDDGVTLIGARATVLDNVTVGAINYFGWNTFDTFYTEGEYHRQLDRGLDFRVSTQFTRQASVGDELIGDFSTKSAGVRFALGWRDFVFKLAGTATSDDFAIQKPWGGSPSYLSIQRLDFDRAGEKAWSLGASFDAKRWLDGLSGFVTFAFGSDAESSDTGAALPDRNEFDITIDYRHPRGALKGFWLRARANFIDIEGDGEDVRDYRLIVNYPIRVF